MNFMMFKESRAFLFENAVAEVVSYGYDTVSPTAMHAVPPTVHVAVLQHCTFRPMKQEMEQTDYFILSQ